MTRGRRHAAQSLVVAFMAGVLMPACASAPGSGAAVVAAPATRPTPAGAAAHPTSTETPGPRAAATVLPSQIAPPADARRRQGCGEPPVIACELDALFGAPLLQPALLSVLVESLDTGEVLYRLNPDAYVVPASNQKIVTMATAAARLGWDFRFTTSFLAAGPIERGELRGDLIVRGGGDPSINAREKRTDAFLDEAAALLRSRGVSRVAGRLVGDDNAFDDERFGDGWSWDDFAYGYSAPIGALQIDENVATLAVSPGTSEGAPAQVTLVSEGSDLDLVNRVTTGVAGIEADVDIARYPGSTRLTVSGTVPLGSREIRRTAAVDNPTLYFARVVRAGLRRRGIEIAGDGVDADDLPAQAPRSTPTELGTVSSPPLSEIGKTLMKVSQNLYAETVFRAMSLAPGPATVDASRQLAEQTLASWGVAPGQYRIADGSGLSRVNFVSAQMIVRILRAMARDPKHLAAFDATLPIAGRDGTIGGRMKGTRAEDNVHAKTGTLGHVRSLSGYLTTAGGERLVFAVIANNFQGPTAAVDAAVDAAMERLAHRPAR